MTSITLVTAMFLLPLAEYVGGGEVLYQLVFEYFCNMHVKTEDGGLLRFPRFFEKSVWLIKQWASGRSMCTSGWCMGCNAGVFGSSSGCV